MSTTSYEESTKADLLAEAKSRGLSVTAANSKQDIIDALEADDANGGTVVDETTEESTENGEETQAEAGWEPRWEPREGPVYAESGPSKEPEQIEAEEAAAEEESDEEPADDEEV